MEVTQLRDKIAIEAMKIYMLDGGFDWDAAAKYAYSQADSMIKERNKL